MRRVIFSILILLGLISSASGADTLLFDGMATGSASISAIATRGSATSQVVPYLTTLQTVTSGGSGVSRYEYLNIGNRSHIRQSGTCGVVRVATASLTGVTNKQIEIWRPKPTNNYYLVGKSENIVSKVTASTISTITLSTPITGVQVGDYIGELIEGTLSGNIIYFQTTTGSDLYRRVDIAVAPSPHNWTGNPLSGSTIAPIECYMTQPDFAVIGDSILEGVEDNISAADMVNTGLVWNPAATVDANLINLIYNRTGYVATSQNLAIGGQTTAQILARFSTDLVALKPTYAILNGGNNDLNTSVPKATFLANWTSMLDACVGATPSIIPIVMLMPPNNGWNTSQMRTRDDWNASLKALAQTYPTAIVVDPNPYVGTFRVGGDAGNLWNQLPAFSAGDSMAHLNVAGYNTIATAILDAMIKKSQTVVFR